MKDNFKITRDYFWQGKLVRLRPMKQEDWQAWYQDSTDTAGVRLLDDGVKLPVTPEMAIKWAEGYVAFNNDKRIMFSIEDIKGKLVGGINLNSIDEKNGTFSIGIRTYRSHRNKGYAHEAMRILLRYAFFERRLVKCNSACMEGNTASEKLHKSLGFLKEGVRRKQTFTNGKYFDDLLFGLTKKEFEENEKQTSV